MAKLTGVKVIEAKAGVIEKVAYEGAEYVKVEGKAEEGDLIRTNDNWCDATEGEFYECIDLDEDDDAEIVGNIGEVTSHYRVNYEVFREVTDATPDLEARVSTLESDVAALKCGLTIEEDAEDDKWAKIGRSKDEYKEGDVVRFLGWKGCHGLNDYKGITTIIESGGGVGDFILEVPEYLGEIEYVTYTLVESMELVTPVESRFDVPAE